MTEQALYISGSLGLGHVVRDLAIAVPNPSQYSIPFGKELHHVGNSNRAPELAFSCGSRRVSVVSALSTLTHTCTGR